MIFLLSNIYVYIADIIHRILEKISKNDPSTNKYDFFSEYECNFSKRDHIQIKIITNFF